MEIFFFTLPVLAIFFAITLPPPSTFCFFISSSLAVSTSLLPCNLQVACVCSVCHNWKHAIDRAASADLSFSLNSADWGDLASFIHHMQESPIFTMFYFLPFCATINTTYYKTELNWFAICQQLANVYGREKKDHNATTEKKRELR